MYHDQKEGYLFQLLIVEDEDYVRESLAEAMDWTIANCAVAAAVADPSLALEFLQTHEIDVVVSDIRMDSMDGLEFARRAQASHPSLQFIFITGYGEIDYARKAFERHAWDFLLKPIQPDELLQTTRSLTDKLMRERRDARHLERLEQSVLEAKPLVCQHLLRRAFGSQEAQVLAEVERLLRRYDVGFADFSVALVEVSGDDRPAGLCQALVMGLLAESAPDHGDPHGVSMDAHVVAIVGPFTSMTALANRITSELQTRYNLVAAIGVSSSHRQFVDIQTAIREAREALIGARAELVPSVKRFRTDLLRLPQPERSSSGETSNAFERVYDLLEPATLGHVSRVIETMSELESAILDADESERLGLDLATRLHTISEICLHRNGLPVEPRSHLPSNLDTTPEAEFAHARRRVVAATREIRRRKETGWPDHLTVGIRYIEDHFATNLTVGEVAHACSLSTKHLCRLLKQHTGSTFTWLLAETRIRNAEVLLANPNLTIADISYSVGYSDPSYFSRVFRRLRGVSPLDFRNQLHAAMSR